MPIKQKHSLKMYIRSGCVIPPDKWYNNYLRIILRDHYERIHENRNNSP